MISDTGPRFTHFCWLNNLLIKWLCRVILHECCIIVTRSTLRATAFLIKDTMSANPYLPPAADLERKMPADTIPALWSPGVAAGLAFFLSPIFGALINMKNWDAMGEPVKARQSMMWIYGTVGFYVLMLVAAFSVPDEFASDGLYRAAGLGFFIAWYMTSGKDQKDVVEYRYGKTFPKRGWAKPVLISIGAYITLIIAVVAVIGVMAD